MPAVPGESAGHGKLSEVENGLLASPSEDGSDAARDNARRKRTPDNERERLAGPRRPVGPGGERDPADARKRREELADRARERREAQRLQNGEEMEKLSPEDRRKIASAVSDSVEKGVPALAAARVVQLVLKSGRSADDAVTAVRALNAAVGKGVPARRFIAGLERVLVGAPEDASLERILRKLLDSLEKNGKTN
jgi:hypothetical protein